MLSYIPTKRNQLSTSRRLVPLSLQKGASFCKHSFSATFPSCPFNVYENIFCFTPAICKDCTFPSRRLADLWALAHTDLRIFWFAQTANIVCGSLICLFSSSLACSILASVFSAQTANEVCGLYPFFPERETCCLLSCIPTRWYQRWSELPGCNHSD